MKKAFTMMELVFVIAIIGILAAVVAPKLMGTRTDAEIAKLKEQVRAINTSIQAYSKQKMIITNNMDEDENYPKTLNDKGVLFGKVLGGADVSKWAQDTLGGAKRDNLYTYDIKGYGKFWCAYIVNSGERDRFNDGSRKDGYPIVGDWSVGDFKCYQFKSSKGGIDNSVLKNLFNVERK